MSMARVVGDTEQIDFSVLLDLANSFSDDGVINFNSLRSLLIGIVKTLRQYEGGISKVNLTQNKAIIAANSCAETALKIPLVFNAATQCFTESAHDSKSRVMSSAFNCHTADDFNCVHRPLDDALISKPGNECPKSQNTKNLHQKHSKSSEKGKPIPEKHISSTLLQCAEEKSNAAKIFELNDITRVLTRAARNAFAKIERIEDILATNLLPYQFAFDDFHGNRNPFATNSQLTSINYDNIKNSVGEGKLLKIMKKKLL